MEKDWIKNYGIFWDKLILDRCFGCRKYNLISILIKIDKVMPKLYLINDDNNKPVDLFKEFNNEKIGKYYPFLLL